MAEGFDSFNAPQFFDFSKDLHNEDNVDSYFEFDHENIQSKDPSQDPLILGNFEDVQDEEKSYAPHEVFAGSSNEYEKKEPRRSMSVGDIKVLCDGEVKKNDKAVEHINLCDSEKNSSMYRSYGNLKTTASNMSAIRTSSRLTRHPSKENLDRLAQPKKYGSAQNLNQGNYVSMAEAVKKFHSGTPTRFRSKPKYEVPCGAIRKLTATIPQSPALMSKYRHRPVQVISREEQERLEFEEAQRFKIKANPLNKKILQGPLKPVLPMEKKPTTVVEPFNITAMAPRKVAESPKKDPFHARPVPKVIYEPSKLEQVPPHITKPQTPTFMKRYTKGPVVAQESKEEQRKTVELGRTKLVPFSFESRDQNMLKKREELIKKVMEEEKKAREFHARPMPKAVVNPDQSTKVYQRSNSTGSLQSNNLTKSEENVALQFKARPATVLYKKPFETKKERHLIEITEFELNTERRAKERETFEQFKKEKEEQISQLKQLQEDLRLQKEEEEVARLRKESEYKAKPVKKYKEVKIQPSGKVTEPISPNFHTDRRRKENKENSN